jgi:hypothetical protein
MRVLLGALGAARIVGVRAPEYSNYALSWIGMANTKFLFDLYLEGINWRCWLFLYRYMGLPGLGPPSLTLTKQMFKIENNCLYPSYRDRAIKKTTVV